MLNLNLKCLWSEICFCLVLKVTLSKTRFQSLRCLALKVTILQAFKVEPFCPQKWYLNRAVKLLRDNLWRHFGAKIVLTMADRKEKRNLRGRYCVAGAPNQQSCQNTTFTPGIRMYQFPSDPAVRAKWVQFVRRHRHNFKDPTSMFGTFVRQKRTKLKKHRSVSHGHIIVHILMKKRKKKIPILCMV